jgi:hypothetical protein
MAQPSLLDQVRAATRLRHYSIRTEVAYVQVIRRFILYHQKRHPRERRARTKSGSTCRTWQPISMWQLRRRTWPWRPSCFCTAKCWRLICR